MLLDANVLIYAVDRRAERHDQASTWLSQQLNGPRRVGLPWQSLSAFMRIMTHPRASRQPLDGRKAWRQVVAWLDAPVAWVPHPGPDHARILGELVTTYDVRGNLVPDAALAAHTIEHGLSVVCSDTDFAWFRGLRWENPLD